MSGWIIQYTEKLRMGVSTMLTPLDIFMHLTELKANYKDKSYHDRNAAKSWYCI